MITILLILGLYSINIYAEPPDLGSSGNAQPVLFYIGPYAGYNYNLHFPNFTKIENLFNCCPKYESGDGSGFAVGGFLAFRLFPSIDLDLRLGFSDISGSFHKDEYIGNVMVTNSQTNKDERRDVWVDHILESSLMMANIEPTIGFRFFDNFISQIGFKLGYLMTSRINQREVIKSPENYTFFDGSLTQNVFNNVVISKKNALQAFGILGLAYELKIGDDLYLVPEIRYSIPITDISKEADWKVSSFQFGLALKIPVYKAKEKIFIYDTLYKTDTTVKDDYDKKDVIVEFLGRDSDNDDYKRNDTTFMITEYTDKYLQRVPKSAYLSYKLKVIGINSNGKELPNPTIIREEIETEEGFPLLTHIYFPENEYDLQKVNQTLLANGEVGKFDENKLNKDAMEIYSNMLNIIGSRLKKFPESGITIIGCNNNLASETNNQKLSMDRANSIRDYLIGTWGIKPPSIKIKRQNLPNNPGNNTIPDGQDENRRAEIISDNLSIIKPVFIKEVEVNTDPPVIEITPEFDSQFEVSGNTLEIRQKDEMLRRTNNSGKPNKYVWQINENPEPKLELPIEITGSLTDIKNNKASDSKKIKIEQKTISKKREILMNDTIITKFSLILFDYDKAELTQLQKSVLDDISKKDLIKKNSRIIISGFTDRTGEDAYNIELSRKRVNEVMNYLNLEPKNTVIVPVGKSNFFNNDLPQGRSLSRTVTLEIHTPVNK